MSLSEVICYLQLIWENQSSVAPPPVFKWDYTSEHPPPPQVAVTHQLLSRDIFKRFVVSDRINDKKHDMMNVTLKFS